MKKWGKNEEQVNGEEINKQKGPQSLISNKEKLQL